LGTIINEIKKGLYCHFSGSRLQAGFIVLGGKIGGVHNHVVYFNGVMRASDGNWE